VKTNDDPGFRMPRKIPASIAASLASGVVGGVSIGALIGPLGVALGLGLGLAIGFAAGRVIEKEERRALKRTKELDAIIGITEGSLGAGPVSLVPSAPEGGVSEEAQTWLSEWLTPPPPVVES
jgi:hypothetical protein